MIRRVRVQGFKRFADVTFEVPGHVVVAGPNNCGKTTLLQAVASWAYGLQAWRNNNDLQLHNKAYARRRSPVRIFIPSQCEVWTCFGRSASSKGRSSSR